jgi:hypothetical protein
MVINPAGTAERLGGMLCSMICVSLGIAVGVLIGTAIRAGLLHLLVMLTGPRRGTFETTFRVVCYSEGATTVFVLVPVAGAIAYMLASPIYAIVGLKYAHDIPWGRAVLIVVAPLVLFGALAVMGLLVSQLL